MNPLLRFQVLFDNDQSGLPITKEFKAGNLAEPTFDALSSYVFAMSHPNESMDQYDTTFRYQIEERHGTRWVDFEDTEGLGYAMETNQDKSYVYISATIVKKGTAPVIAASPPTAPTRSTQGTTKPKVAKKTKLAKAKAPSSHSTGPKAPVTQLILSSLKELGDLGITAPPRIQIAMFSGYSNIKSKSFNDAMKELESLGFIQRPDTDTVCLTQAGAAQAPSAAAPATNNEQVQERLKKQLKDKAPLVFDVLTDGRSHVCQDVAALVGYSNVKSAGFQSALKQMLSLGMIDHPKDGKKKLVRLTDIAFPFGRPDRHVPNTITSIVPNDA
jgi:predicted transcriptional regulator